ncbi:MAG: S8 family peptidase, partial [Candidatus Uhrbacteria bacterium]
LAAFLIGACDRKEPTNPPQEEQFTAWEDIDFSEFDGIAIDFKDDVTAEEIEEIELAIERSLNTSFDIHLNSAYSGDEKLAIVLDGAYALTADRQYVIALVRALLATGRVERIEPNYIYKMNALTPNDPRYPEQWHMRMIGMPEAWERTKGKGAVVAVIDTGVAYLDWGKFKKAPDLADTAFVDGYDFVNDRKQACDDHGHGTHVAGTIAQSTDNGIGVAGIAPEATIMPLKVLSARGSGSLTDIADAVRFAADHGAHVINMSLGGGGRSSIFESAINYAKRKGVTVICAAGNGGKRKVEYPAAYPASIAVSAVGPSRELAFYSSYGPELAIAAPGGDKSTGEENGVLQNTLVRGNPEKFTYEFYQGTSMATPHVAGVAALIVSQGVTNPDTVRKVLTESADDVGKSGHDDKYGYGILNADKATLAAEDVTEPLAGAGPGLLAAILSMAMVGYMRRKKIALHLGPTYIVGIVAGACGLFFLNELYGNGSFAINLLSTGALNFLAMVIGHGTSASAALYSGGLPIIIGLFAKRWTGLRALAGGVGIGVGAQLLFEAVLGVHQLAGMDSVFSTGWLATNALISVLIAFFAIRKGRK